MMRDSIRCWHMVSNIMFVADLTQLFFQVSSYCPLISESAPLILSSDFPLSSESFCALFAETSPEPLNLKEENAFES